MVVNLFVRIAAHHPGARASYFSGSAASIGWAIAGGPGWLAVHVALGQALIAAGIARLALALRTRTAGAITTAMTGFLAILGGWAVRGRVRKLRDRPLPAPSPVAATR
jgi:hypothetical protein